MSSIPVIDISTISLSNEDPSIEDYKFMSKIIGDKLENIGFLYINNHGIPQEVIDNAMKTSYEFFQMDNDAKNVMKKGPEYQGWVAQGREIFEKELELREAFDIKNISESGKFPDEVRIFFMYLICPKQFLFVRIVLS